MPTDLICRRVITGVIAAIATMGGLATECRGVIIGQIDTFESGDTLNWSNGPDAPDPINVATGGPAGDGDHFLQISASGGFGAGGKLITFNRSQWLGNYNAAGVTQLEMDLKNLDNTSPIQTLFMRIGFKQSTAGGGPSYVTTHAFSLPADGAWHHAVFGLTGATMTGLSTGALTLSQLLSNPAEMRIFSSASLSSDGDVTSSRFGVDNIQAIQVVVPEPGTFSLLCIAALLLICRRGREWPLHAIKSWGA
jgi:hypothetical protein